MKYDMSYDMNIFFLYRIKKMRITLDFDSHIWYLRVMSVFFGNTS